MGIRTLVNLLSFLCNFLEIFLPKNRRVKFVQKNPRKRSELSCDLYDLLGGNGSEEADRAKEISIHKGVGKSAFLHCEFQPFLQLLGIRPTGLLV